MGLYESILVGQDMVNYSLIVVCRFLCLVVHRFLHVSNENVNMSVPIVNENENNNSRISGDFTNKVEMFNNMEGTIGDDDEEKLHKLFEDSEKPLYIGCTKFSKLSAVIRLFKVKAKYGLSDTSFTTILETFHEMLPEDNGLPVSVYQAKKMMCPMGLEIERIDACPNDCILYRKEYKDLHNCVICNESRYKSKKGNKSKR